MIQLIASQQFKLLAKTIHTCAACSWIGGGFAVLVLLNNSSHTNNSDELFAFNYAITSIDDFLIRPAAALSVMSGAFLCLTSRWGVTKYRWIIFKWIVTISAMAFGLFYLDPCMKELAQSSKMFRDLAIPDSTYQKIFTTGVIAGYLQTAILLTLVLVSIFKPGFCAPETKNRTDWHISAGILRFIRNIN